MPRAEDSTIVIHLALRDEFVIQTKQINHARDILFAANVKRDPTRFGQKVMRRRAPLRNQLLAHAHRKRQIGLTIAMHVSDFAMSNAIFGPAKPVRFRAYVLPFGDSLMNLFGNIRHGIFIFSKV